LTYIDEIPQNKPLGWGMFLEVSHASNPTCRTTVLPKVRDPFPCRLIYSSQIFYGDQTRSAINSFLWGTTRSQI